MAQHPAVGVTSRQKDHPMWLDSPCYRILALWPIQEICCYFYFEELGKKDLPVKMGRSIAKKLL
jgi:hypothetical protein